MPPMRMVRYSSGGLIRRIPYRRLAVNPNLKRAIAVGNFVYKHRDKARKIAKWGVRMWRGRRAKTMLAAKRRRYIGDPPRARGPANRQDENLDRNLNSRTLYFKEITRIDKHTTTDSINLPGRRNSNVIHLSGFRYCFQIRNLKTEPLQWHIAIVIPRDPVAFSVGSKSDKFFRAHSGTTRETDFDDALTSVEFECLPINPAKFRILKHKRFMIRPKGDTAYNVDMPNYVSLKEWVSLGNKRFTYSDVPENVPMQPGVFLLHWHDVFDTSGGTAPRTNTCAIQERYVTYWRDQIGG